METLLENLRAATEGSRALDAEIWLYLGWGDDDQYYGPAPVPPFGMVNGMTMLEAFERFPSDIDGIARAWNVPPMTTSMDSAHELLREIMCEDAQKGIRRYVGIQENSTDDEHRRWTTFVEWKEDGENIEVSPTAPTPALALCIAAVILGKDQ